MSTKKGNIILLVNAQTTAEFLADDSIYPAYSVLFEILEDGKFKMRMSDGVHHFRDLPYILTNCDAKVVTDTAEEYRIEFTTPWEKFTTPNLRGPQGNTGLTGKGLAYKWNGTKLSVGSIPEGGSDIEWSDPVDLKGITGQGTDYAWEGTSLKLGIIPAGGSETNWGEPVDLKGDKGEKGDTGTVGIMLDAEPTEDTLTYIVGDVTYNFELGMSAIYPDSESDNGYGLSFFMGVTSEGKAIWGKGGGGAGSLNETVMISLVSNQDEAAAPDADLLGKSVHVIYGDQDKELVWQGEVMKTTVPMNMTYQVVFPAEGRYKCPAQQEYIALAGETREVKGLYYTEVVKVTVSSDDSSDVTGQQVTINGTQYAWAGTTIEVKIPHDVEYSVSVSAKAGYTTPTTVTTTAAQKLNEISMQYLLIKVNTITIDQTVSDPATMVSGDVNGDIIQWIRNNSHRVLAKKTADGVLTYCRLNDANSTQYYDGTTAALDGTQGDVFLKLPEFYYKGTEGDQVNIMFAKEQVDDEYIRWDPNTLIGVYEAYNGSSKMYSRSGVASTGNISQSTWKTYAAARGTGYQLVDWQMHCVMGCLYYAMYGNTNCQNSIGKGVSSYDKTCGQTDSLGMTDTVAGGNGDSQSINYWGLENWWGNKYEWIHDYNNPANSLSATVNDPVNGGTRSLPIFDYGGYYPKKMKFGRYLDLIATTDDPKNGSDTVGYCDYQWWPGSTNSEARVVRRSYYYSYTNGGVACASAYYTASYAGSSYGSRLAFRGSLVEAENVSAFKALSVTN